MRLGIITIIVVGSLLAVGLVGVMEINMTGSNGQYSCPISSLPGNNCAPSNSPFVEAFHHISGLQSIVQGAVNADTISLEILTLLISAFSILGIFFLKAPSLQTSYQGYRRAADFRSPKQQLLRWLALREMRDPNAPQGVHDYS